MKQQITILICIIFVLYSNGALAQTTVSGFIFDENKEAAVGANIYSLGTTNGTVSDVDGAFSLDIDDTSNNVVVVSYVGFVNDTITVTNFDEVLIVNLSSGVALEEFQVKEERRASFISGIKTQKTEIITENELFRAACCNLSESFETNASVNVGNSDAVSGAKQISMLGLDGNYVQMLTENMPTLRGLASTFGLSYIPGPWMQSISITKGTGSVVNGYEPITGQINTEYKKPDQSDPFFLNLYGNQAGRMEANITAAHKLSDKASTMVLLHGSHFNQKIDHNHDGFLDMPRWQVFNGINRWKFNGDKMMGQFGIKFLTETRNGGQLTYNEKQARTTSNGYGVGINTQRVEGWAKTGILFNDPYQSIGLQLTFLNHQQNAFYGLSEYSGTENYLYFNAIYQNKLFNDKQKITAGASFVYDRYDEQFNQTDFFREEIVPGIFTEYTYNNSENISFVAGIRGDYHNLYGLQLNPRMHFKYTLGDYSTFRASAGRGFRVANIFAENNNIFVSGRTIEVAESLQPEVAWNYGFSYVQNFELAYRTGYFSFDAYRTVFQNQIITDVFSTVDRIQFYNLDGDSYANSLQVELFYELAKKLEFKIAYKFDDVRTTFNGTLLNMPLTPRHLGLVNFSYESLNERWRFNVTGLIDGKQYLYTQQADNGVNDIIPEESPAYFHANAQVTHIYKNLEVYVGSENLTNFRQLSPIIDADNPFGQTFDATNVWGPIFGRMVYAGLRFKINKKESK